MIARLEKDGYPVVAAANPLRSVKTDGEYVRRLVSSLNTSVILVGHSYGGSVITEAAEQGHVKSLVYVVAFTPEAGETMSNSCVRARPYRRISCCMASSTRSIAGS